MPTAVSCSRRKEKACKEVPDICSWDGAKCSNKAQVAAPAKKVVCAKRKEKACKEAAGVCAWDGTTCKPVGVVARRTSSPPPRHLLGMDNRHCTYYSTDARAALEHTDVIRLDTCYKTPYDPAFASKTNVHIGQRKLMLSEIQLLTRYYANAANKRGAVVLYVGAAPGTHLILLSIMFPTAAFVLYDGAKYDPVLKNYPDIYEIHEGKDGFVTTDVIRRIKYKYDSKSLVFVSDIRLGNEDRDLFETAVAKDMVLQQEWVEILKPNMSLLKFRLPYNMKHGDAMKYFKGDLLYGVWPKPSSGESRLLVEQKDIRTKVKYDFKEYEETMAFHNKYRRPYCFGPSDVSHAIKRYVEGKDNAYCPCYDCVSELTILHTYAKTMRQKFDATVQQFGEYMNRERRPVFLTKAGLTRNPPLIGVVPDCKFSPK